MPRRSSISNSATLQEVFDQSNNTYSDEIYKQINEKERVIETIVSKTITPRKNRLSDRSSREFKLVFNISQISITSISVVHSLPGSGVSTHIERIFNKAQATEIPVLHAIDELLKKTRGKRKLRRATIIRHKETEEGLTRLRETILELKDLYEEEHKLKFNSLQTDIAEKSDFEQCFSLYKNTKENKNEMAAYSKDKTLKKLQAQCTDFDQLKSFMSKSESFEELERAILFKSLKDDINNGNHKSYEDYNQRLQNIGDELEKEIKNSWSNSVKAKLELNESKKKTLGSLQKQCTDFDELKSFISQSNSLDDLHLTIENPRKGHSHS